MTTDSTFSAINQDILNTLSKYFVYDKVFDLFKYRTCPEKLHGDLSQLTKSNYAHNYRFVFIHYEPDDYIFKDRPCVSLTNLQNIVWSLNISNYFCLVISQHNLIKELAYLQQQFTTDDYAIACIQNQLWYTTEFKPQKHATRQVDIDKITKKYISLNLVKRFHRRCMLSVLKHRNLFDQGLITYGGSRPNE